MGWEEFRKGFFVGLLSIADLCVLRVSAFQRRSCGPLNAEAQSIAEDARSGKRIGTLYGILIECKSLRSLRLCVSRKGSEPVNAEAQRNAEGARSGEGDWNFLWNAYRMQISAFSASLRFKEGILRTGKRRGAEERGGYAVGEKDWRGRGWEGRSSGRDFLLDPSRLQISAFSALLRFKEGILRTA